MLVAPFLFASLPLCVSPPIPRRQGLRISQSPIASRWRSQDLWSTWADGQGQSLHSFTMLTINAQDHAVMNRFHKPEDEKRMVVILPRGCWKNWLLASPDSTPAAVRSGFLRGYSAQRLMYLSA
ncbi:MAG: SOS response-associated peptidase family protein [Burkholderiaceae bacterium]